MNKPKLREKYGIADEMVGASLLPSSTPLLRRWALGAPASCLMALRECVYL